MKECYEEVWEVLQTRKEALWAGIKALSEQKEMLGEELVSRGGLPHQGRCCFQSLSFLPSSWIGPRTRTKP